MFIQPLWPAPAEIRAYTSLRAGGCSQAPYDQFNLAYHVEDQKEHVAANREKLRKALQLPHEPLWLNQVHGTTALPVLPENLNKDADSSFTHQTNQVCAIMTADCLPLLLCQPQGSAIAAIHAGWRGLAQGVIENTLAALKVNNSELLAWLGPAIGPKHFEVGEEVYASFLAKNPENKAAFVRAKANTWLADIYELARILLRAFGVSAIYGGEYCTFSQKQLFFSHRRDQGKTGRMVTLIWRENEGP